MIGNILNNVESFIVFIAVLSVLILVHEWGHFITAKRLGIEVQRFALGFGPALYSKVYKGTTYMINAIPLGGYVKMAGDERSECSGKPGEFYSKPVGHRALVVVNGPVVNFVLAYVSFVLVFMGGYPGQSAIITDVEEGGPGYSAGIRPGDQIVAIDGSRTYGWLNIESRLEGNSEKPLMVSVIRDDGELKFLVDPIVKEKPNIVGRSRKVRDLGINNLPNVVGGVVEDYPAEKAGLIAGDRIVEIDGRPTNSWNSLQKAISESTGRQIVVKFIRDGKTLTKAIVPKIDINKDPEGNEVSKRKIGIGPQDNIDLFYFGIKESLVFAGEELVFITKLTYESLFRMVTGAVSAKESVTGPVGIFYIVKGAAESGFSHLLFILGIISASLAIFNLLPVIPLDGGHIFLFALEKIRGKALAPRLDEYIARAGFSLIILLALFVFYSDFDRFGWFKHIGTWFGNLGYSLIVP